MFSKQSLLHELGTMKAATIATVTMAFKKEQLGDLDALSFMSREIVIFRLLLVLG